MTVQLRKCLLISAFLPACVFAASKQPLSTNYVSGGVLFTMPEFFNSISPHNSNLGAHGSFGFIRPLNETFCLGAEAGVGYYGRTSWITNTDFFNLSTVGFDATGVIDYHATPSVSVRGRAGVALMVDRNLLLGPAVESTYNAAPLFGTGIRYQLNHRLKLAFDYTHISGRAYYEEDAGRGLALTKHPEFNTFKFGVEYNV